MDNYQQPMYQQPAPKAGFADKLRSVPKIAWIICAAVLVLVIALIIILSVAGGSNKPETPIKTMEKYAAMDIVKVDDIVKSQVEMLNGVGTKHAKAIYKLFLDAPIIQGEIAQSEAEMNQRLLEAQAKGYDPKNHSVTMQVNAQIPLTPAEIAEYKTNLVTMATEYKTRVAMAKIPGSEEYTDLMKYTGWNDKQIQKYLNELDALCDELLKADVTEGYKLMVMETETGSRWQVSNGDLTPSIDNEEYYVIKVGGRWVEWYSFRSAIRTLFNAEF